MFTKYAISAIGAMVEFDPNIYHSLQFFKRVKDNGELVRFYGGEIISRIYVESEDLLKIAISIPNSYLISSDNPIDAELVGPDDPAGVVIVAMDDELNPLNIIDETIRGFYQSTNPTLNEVTITLEVIGFKFIVDAGQISDDLDQINNYFAAEKMKNDLHRSMNLHNNQ